MSLLSLCNLSGAVQRATVTYDATGGQVRTWLTLVSGEPCCVQPVRGAAPQGVHAKPEMDVDHNIYFSRIVDVRINDRVVVDGRYYVVKASGDMAGRVRYTKVWAKKVDQA